MDSILNHKDLKKLNIEIPQHLNDLKPDAISILECNEYIILKVLEKTVYGSKLPIEIIDKINDIFAKSREHIISML